MLSDPLRTALEAAIGRATGTPFAIGRATAASGGCIHSSWVLESGATRYFAKTNDARFAATFAAEADGLVALAGAGAARARDRSRTGKRTAARSSSSSISSSVAGPTRPSASSGASLRACTRTAAASSAGIATTSSGSPRSRTRGTRRGSSSGSASGSRRSSTLAARNGHRGELQSLGSRVIEAVPQLLAGHSPAPSLLHGDLWSGNVGFLADGTPVVFDPAVYYGDAEADLAMTELFGGFPPSFYEGYREVRPIAAGYPVRRALYNLYHVLNHLNLFGEGYRSQAERMMARVLSG